MPTPEDLISDVDKLLTEAMSPLNFMRHVLSEGYHTGNIEINQNQWNTMITSSIRKLEEMRDRVKRYVKEKKKVA